MAQRCNVFIVADRCVVTCYFISMCRHSVASSFLLSALSPPTLESPTNHAQSDSKISDWFYLLHSPDGYPRCRWMKAWFRRKHLLTTSAPTFRSGRVDKVNIASTPAFNCGCINKVNIALRGDSSVLRPCLVCLRRGKKDDYAYSGNGSSNRWRDQQKSSGDGKFHLAKGPPKTIWGNGDGIVDFWMLIWNHGNRARIYTRFLFEMISPRIIPRFSPLPRFGRILQRST